MLPRLLPFRTFDCSQSTKNGYTPGMGLFSKKEFAGKVGMSTRTLAVHIIRKKVLVSDNLIDDALQINQEFLERYSGRISSPSEGAVATSGKPRTKPRGDKNNSVAAKEIAYPGKSLEDMEKTQTLYSLDKEQKVATIEKTKADIQLLAMKRDKMRGLVIPTDIVRALFMQHSKSIVVSFEQGVDKMIIEIAKKAKLGRNDIAELRGKMILIVNESVDAAVKESQVSIKNLVEEYSSLKSGE